MPERLVGIRVPMQYCNKSAIEAATGQQATRIIAIASTIHAGETTVVQASMALIGTEQSLVS